MSDVISKRMLSGRPFGGIAIFIRQHLAAKVTVVKLSSRYIILQVGSTMLINFIFHV